eukprot:g12383.t1
MFDLLSGKPTSCERWVLENFTVSLQNDATYATFVPGRFGAATEACVASNREQFQGACDNPCSAQKAKEFEPSKHSPSAPAFVNGSHEKQGPTVRHQMQTSSLRSPLVKSQRPSTPDSQRRRSERDRRGSGQEASSRASSVSSRTLRHHEAPVHERLYQEKDERRRRLEQARLRRLEQEEEDHPGPDSDLRMAAQKALGRQPSPARRREPSPGPESLKVETSRGKPPVPERHVDGNDRRSKQLRKPVDGSDDAKLLSLPQNATETSSVASEHLGPQSMASVGTGVEDSASLTLPEDKLGAHSNWLWHRTAASVERPMAMIKCIGFNKQFLLSSRGPWRLIFMAS